MSLTGLRALIIGGGFSGLATAIMLARGGAEVELVERNAEWTMDGAGISVGAASMRALHHLGAHDRFLEEGAGCDGTDARDASGALLTTFPTPRLVDPDTPGNGAILRPVLGRMLVDLALAAGVRPRLGTTVTERREHGGGVTVVCSDGATLEVDLVVAADGLFSETRAEVLPDAPHPTYSGQSAWRAIVPRPPAIERTTIWVGGSVKVGVNPISAHEMYLFVNEDRETRDRVPESALVPHLRRMLADFDDPVLVDARASLGPDSRVLVRPMDNLLVPLPWHRGRVVLIGDAVHATTPHLAAGAGLGLEDAIVLAEELARDREIDSALDAFEQRRWERCRMAVEHSEELGRLETVAGAERAYTALQTESFRRLAEPF